MPSDPVARELLRLTNIPVAAPSANLSGKPSPTLGEHAINDLAGKIEVIIDAGPCPAGVKSTVLSLSGAAPVILRPGVITREEMEKVLGEPILLAKPGDNDRPPSPGMKYRHYAPEAPVTLYEGEPEKIVREINQRLAEMQSVKKVVILGTTENASAVIETNGSLIWGYLSGRGSSPGGFINYYDSVIGFSRRSLSKALPTGVWVLQFSTGCAKRRGVI